MSGYAAAGDPGLDKPWYGIGFGDALKRWTKKLFVFDGRASRGEYWWVFLVTFLVNAVINGILQASSYQAMMSAAQSGVSPSMGVGGTIGTIISLVVFVITLAIAVRRLHDANFSGWFYLLSLIPCIGFIIVIIMLAMPSKPEGARFDKV